MNAFWRNCSNRDFLFWGLMGKLCRRWGDVGWKLDVRIFLRNVRGSSAASAQRLSPGLVRKAPSAGRSEVLWMILSKCNVVLLARLQIGAP